MCLVAPEWWLLSRGFQSKTIKGSTIYSSDGFTKCISYIRLESHNCSLTHGLQKVKNFPLRGFSAWLIVWHKRLARHLAYRGFQHAFPTSSVICSFWFKVRSNVILPFTEHSEAMVEFLIGLCPCCWSQGLGRPEEKERDGGMNGLSVEQSEHTQHWLIKFSLIWVFVVPLNNYNSTIKDHGSGITITNTIIRKKFEILQKLPKN